MTEFIWIIILLLTISAFIDSYIKEKSRNGQIWQIYKEGVKSLQQEIGAANHGNTE